MDTSLLLVYLGVLLLLAATRVTGDLRRHDECLYTHFGTAYVGDISVTRSGKTCQRWDTQTPHSHPHTNPDMYPDTTLADAGNKCRNPNGVRAEGVWCYTTDVMTEWEYCDVPYCECKIYRSGHGYLGTHAATYIGIPCQRWDTQTPHAHTYTAEDFPDLSIQDAGNKCRNPDVNWHSGTFCYTSSPNTRYQHCSLPFCECKTTELGDKYEGYLNVTVSGRSCQAWTEQTPHPHSFTDISMFPDTRFAAAGSYCRNPDDSEGGPWCYTTDPDTTWEYCTIPSCEYLEPASLTTTTTTTAPPTTPYTGPVPTVNEVTEKPATTVQECKYTRTGSSYRGSASTTISGKTCQAWTAQTPHLHPKVGDDRVSDASIADAANNCRNPNMASLGPWCYTTSADTRHEYCNLPLCECKISRGDRTYMGLKHKTKSGFTCQSWSVQTPHHHDYTDTDFPDGSVADAANYCRNPRGDNSEGPWCLTTDPAIRWERCSLPYCECREDLPGMDYSGTVSTTVSGRTCQRWDAQTPHSHSYDEDSMFPEGHAHDSHNYCRNPDDQEPNGPWCYTTDPDKRWEYCDISLCELDPPAAGADQEVHPPAPTQAPAAPGKPAQDCKLSRTGETYKGSISHTVSYRACQRWDQQQPHRHQFITPGSFPDTTLQEAGDACRNPDRSRPDGPWCYTLDPEVEWEYCPIPDCGCKVNKGGWTYTGTMSVTRKGYACQRWDSQAPHAHPYTKIEQFPDDTFADSSNYCRNPDMWEPEGPWCLTTDPDTVWDYCDVPHCECTTTKAGREYGGKVNKTRAGVACQQWSAQTPHAHRYYNPCPFPDDDVAAAENYCRNPEQNEFGGTWCFTSDPNKQWDYCDIPACEDDGKHPLVSVHSDSTFEPQTGALQSVGGASSPGGVAVVVVLSLLVVVLSLTLLITLVIYPRRASIQAACVRAKDATTKAFDNPLYAETPATSTARFNASSVRVEVPDLTLQPPDANGAGHKVVEQS